MGGQAGGRGYLIQSLICVLEMLRDESWSSVVIEPDVESEKVDILWVYPDNTSKFLQVKSSQNQLSVPMVKRWAEQMRETKNAGEYELWLIGPCSQGVLDLVNHQDVRIQRPQSLDVPALIERAAHRLDSYFHQRGIMRVPPFVKELLIEALATKVSTYSADGRPLARNELDDQFSRWVLESYPPSVSKAVEMQCVALWDEVWVPRQTTRGTYDKKMIVDVTLLSEAVRTCLIRQLFIVVSTGDKRSLYLPTHVIDTTAMLRSGSALDYKFELRRCGELALRRRRPRRVPILFAPHAVDPWKPNGWEAGSRRFQLYALFADSQSPVLLRDDLIVSTEHDYQYIKDNNDVRIPFQVAGFSFDVG
jgi:hypothetical protein